MINVIIKGKVLKPSLSFLSPKGFTLIEMIIAVAIIGVLAAVAVPNFKKYQAKSKTVEAKLQLAQIYTAQTAFYQLFDLYATCLEYMGFNPASEKANRYFAVGFIDFSANLDEDFYNAAVGERLVSSECPRDMGEVEDKTFFLAGKSVGQFKIDSLAKFQNSISIRSNSLNDDSGPFSYSVHSGIGDQSLKSTKVFTATAAGIIDSTNPDSSQASLWTINHQKRITNFRSGY